MSWLQIKIETTPEQSEFHENLLLAAGCAVVTFQDTGDQPIFEPELGTTPLWQKTSITGLFTADCPLKTTIDFIQKEQLNHHPNQPLPSIKSEILEDKDWEREWMDNYKPMQFGERLWVCPTWLSPPDTTAVNLMLDPGLAFGTGTHPTTALCLEWLDSQQLNNCYLIDYGCGSGILAIAALLLGATKVTGIDIDPQALEASRNNLQTNQIDHKRLQLHMPEDAPTEQADILIANILAEPLIQLAEEFSQRIKPQGKLCISGLLSTQATSIKQAYSPWFEFEDPREKDGWICIIATRNN